MPEAPFIDLTTAPAPFSPPCERGSANAHAPSGPESAADAHAPAAGQLSPGDLAELLSTFNSVTARVQESHERLRAEVSRLSAELCEANACLERSRRLAALGEMAAGIAHEVRNPLGSIALYARMLEDDLADRESEQGIARKILRAVRGLDAVVHDVLNFAREMRVNPEWVDAGSLFDLAMEASGVSVAGLRVDRSWKTNRSAPDVWCDPVLMRQALGNIIRNAAEANQESGRGPGSLVLSARREGRGAATVMCLSVRDTGTGVPEDALERLFNPFYTTRRAGTGLGLAIVHRIVDAHGGSVRISNVSSPPGAIVELRLPLAPAQDTIARGAPSMRLGSTPITPAERAA